MRLTLTGCGLLVCVAIGCDRNSAEVRVQRAPKQARPVMMPAQMPAPDPHTGGQQDNARPVHWTVPDGWKELPGASMRFATFVVNDEPKVELTVVPLAGDSGGLLANVNRWEGQLGLKPSAEQDLPKIAKRIEVGDHSFDVVDLLGPEAGNPRQRMLAASVLHDGRTWYFKMAGPEAIVAQQKEKFDAFVKSIHFVETTPQAAQEERAAKPQAAVENASGISYAVPDGWTKAPDRTMRVVTYTVGAPPQQAEMIASKFPVNSGTVLENFNRWRGQVGMTPLQQADQQSSKPISVGGADGIYLDLAGAQNRMLVAWVTHGNDWWFFKLTGPAATIEKQQASFDSFLKSIKFAGDEPKP